MPLPSLVPRLEMATSDIPSAFTSRSVDTPSDKTNVGLVNTQTGMEYLIELSIGSPAQNVFVQLDTGSTDLWVDPDCRSAPTSADQELCASMSRFDYQAFSTFVDLKASYELFYGSGNATVEWATEYVTAGCMSTCALSSPLCPEWKRTG